MPHTLIFDLDGTLIDSAPDLGAALDRLVTARGVPGFTRPEVVGMIGDGVDALVSRAMAARRLPFSPAAVAAFRADYGARCTELTQPFPGTAETLRALAEQGWRLGVCTNKPEAPARAILQALGLAPLVRSVTGGDGPRKPDPAHMLAAVRAAGGEPSQAIALGDHANDVRAALAAGMSAIFAVWGYGTMAMADGAAAIATTITEVPQLASTLLHKMVP